MLFGVLSGLRPCELLALTWDCVDFDKAEILVNKAVVLGQYKLPKTKESLRRVELNSHAIKILKAQFEITGTLRERVIRILQADNKTNIKERVQHVFVSGQTKKPFGDVKTFSTVFFNDFLKASGVKKRGVNQVRHTFASQCLIAGISTEWIRIQMGHTTTHMIELHYGKWLNVDAPNYSQTLSQSLVEVFGNKLAIGQFTSAVKANASLNWCSSNNASVSQFIISKSSAQEMRRCA